MRYRIIGCLAIIDDFGRQKLARKLCVWNPRTKPTRLWIVKQTVKAHFCPRDRFGNSVSGMAAFDSVKVNKSDLPTFLHVGGYLV